MKLVFTAALVAIAGSAFAAPPVGTPTPAAKAPVAKTAAITCPVTGDKIADIKDAAGSSTYKGKTYYFCCAGCKPAFDKNPAKFAKDAAKTPVKPAPAAKPAPVAKA